MKFCFGDIVVVNGNEIGVVVKSWFNARTTSFSYEVYCRMSGAIQEFKESEIERYMVGHKYLGEEEMEHQWNAVNPI